MSAPVVIGYRVSSMLMKFTCSNGRSGHGTSWNFEKRADALKRMRRDVDAGREVSLSRIVIPESL